VEWLCIGTDEDAAVFMVKREEILRNVQLDGLEVTDDDMKWSLIYGL